MKKEIRMTRDEKIALRNVAVFVGIKAVIYIGLGLWAKKVLSNVEPVKADDNTWSVNPGDIPNAENFPQTIALMKRQFKPGPY